MNKNTINKFIKSLSEFNNFKYKNGVLSVIFLYIFYKIGGLIFPSILILSWDISFVDSASPFCEALVDLYYVVWYVLIVILVGVIYILAKIIVLFSWNLSIVNTAFMKDLYNLHLRWFLSVFFIFYELFKRTNMIPFISSINLKSNKKNILNFWYNKRKKKFLDIQAISEYRTLETAWCVTPSFALMSIGNPTFGLIFSLDSTMDPAVTLQVTGHQWYWTYDYHVTMHVPYDSDLYQYTDKARWIQAWQTRFSPIGLSGDELIEYHMNSSKQDSRITEAQTETLFYGLMKLKSVVHYKISFDSTMIAVDDLNDGEGRLYEVSEYVVLPVGVPIKVLITSADVLHSWSIPNFGIKVDAVPGRINQFVFEIKQCGFYRGQCSELCGTMHGYMPIIVKAVPVKEFEQWVRERGTII
jgi:heme/copper-type cytochrome/quinol oxidase subunit 2